MIALWVFQIGETWNDLDCKKQNCTGPNKITSATESGCAENAWCGEDEKGTGTCLCNKGFKGDPFGEKCEGTSGSL